MYYCAKNATVYGDVRMVEGVNIWYGAVVRTGRTSRIEIGAGTNIQDNSVLHVDKGGEMLIGSGVTIGHGAIVHCKEVGDHTLIGMGAILLNGAKVGKNCIIGAGAVITGKMDIPDGSMVVGSPGVVKRRLTEEEIAHNVENARHYVDEAREELVEVRDSVS